MIRIIPKCLQFEPATHKSAAYTSDGFMLPCCWLDNWAAYDDIVQRGLRDDVLKLSKNDSLEQIFGSDQWENFFTTLLTDPNHATATCKRQCGTKGTQ